MICRSLLASAAIVLGAVAIAPSAFAQSVNVPFSGTVGSACSFGTPIAGTLQTTTGPSGSPALSNMPTSRGQVSVNCNQSANLTVSYPVQTSGPEMFTPSFKDARVENLTSSGYGYASSSPLMLSPGNSNLGVDMIVAKSSAFMPGTYNFNVTLTIVP